MIFFKNFISYILVTNSQMFPLLLNMFIYVFFYKQNTLMNKNFRTYNLLSIFLYTKNILQFLYKTCDIIFHLSVVDAQSPNDSVIML